MNGAHDGTTFYTPRQTIWGALRSEDPNHINPKCLKRHIVPTYQRKSCILPADAAKPAGLAASVNERQDGWTGDHTLHGSEKWSLKTVAALKWKEANGGAGQDVVETRTKGSGRSCSIEPSPSPGSSALIVHWIGDGYRKTG